MKSLPNPMIDFHVHLFPDRLFDAVWKRFFSDYGMSILHQIYYRECVRYLRQRGVDFIVYSNYAHKKGTAQGLNEWNLKVLEEIPELYCLAAYHPADKDGPTMAAALLQHPRVLGFKLQLLVQRFYPDDARLFPFYERVIEAGKAILFHVGNGPIGNEFVGIGPFRKLLRRFPDLKAIVAHMGALEFAEFGALLDDYPRLYLDTAFAFLPKLGSMFNLGTAFLERHQDRILYGSDFPNVVFPREEEIDTLLGLDLSQGFYDKVFWKNGMDLIGKLTVVSPPAIKDPR